MDTMREDQGLEIMSNPEAPLIEETDCLTGAGPVVQARDVARWYGEVLGVNRVSVDLVPGITGFVGPNGSGKTTLMNMLCGLLRPSQGTIQAFGQPVWGNPEFRRRLGYCAQVDHFYETFTGEEFLVSLLRLHGRGAAWARQATGEALELVGMVEDRHRRIRAYSKGMRQRIKVALALAHQPEILVLDEPFNGLDPVGRHEMLNLFAEYASAGRTILISSHILHEIEQMTNRILMMSNGFVMAEGEVQQVRDLLRRHPFHVLVRCDRLRELGALMIEDDCVESVRFEDESSMTLSTRDPDRFYQNLGAMILEHGIEVDMVVMADENMQSLYQYLAGRERH